MKYLFADDGYCIKENRHAKKLEGKKKDFRKQPDRLYSLNRSPYTVEKVRSNDIKLTTRIITKEVSGVDYHVPRQKMGNYYVYSIKKPLDDCDYTFMVSYFETTIAFKVGNKYQLTSFFSPDVFIAADLISPLSTSKPFYGTIDSLKEIDNRLYEWAFNCQHPKKRHYVDYDWDNLNDNLKHYQHLWDDIKDQYRWNGRWEEREWRRGHLSSDLRKLTLNPDDEYLEEKLKGTWPYTNEKEWD